MKFIKTFSLFVTLFSLFAMDINSQSVKNYESAWKQVEDFVKKGLPKSALSEVKKIYQLANEEKRHADDAGDHRDQIALAKLFLVKQRFKNEHVQRGRVLQKDRICGSGLFRCQNK